MSTEQIAVRSHYRTLHNGQVIYIHDYHAGHEVNHRSREAHFHERTGQGVNASGHHYLRATDDADAAAIRAAAADLGKAAAESIRAANHHGNVGDFTHFDFDTPGEAAAVLQLAQSKSHHSLDAPIPKELGSLDEDFAQVYGAIDLGAVTDAEVKEQFELVYGDAPKIGGGPYTLTMADLDTLKDRLGVDELNIPDKASFIRMWNEKIKLDPMEAFGPLVGELTNAHSACLEQARKNGEPALDQNGKVPKTQTRRLTLSGYGEGMGFSYNDYEFRCTRTYTFGSTMQVDHDYWQLPSTIRGDGLGKKAFVESINFYNKIGIKKIEVHANINVGGYCWARYRFRCDSPRWLERLKSHFTTNSARLPAAFRDSPAIREALACTDTRAGWLVADYISNCVKMGEASAAANNGRITAEDRAKGAISKEENPLAKNGVWWEGHINMEDADQMGHVWDYITNKPSRVQEVLQTRRRR